MHEHIDKKMPKVSSRAASANTAMRPKTSTSISNHPIENAKASTYSSKPADKSIKGVGTHSTFCAQCTPVIQRFGFRDMAGYAGYAIGGITGGVKGFFSKDGVRKGAKEGSEEGYYRPGAVVGSLIGGTVGTLVGSRYGTKGMVTGGLGGAGLGYQIGEKLNDRFSTVYWRLVNDGRKRYKRLQTKRGPKALLPDVQKARDDFFKQQYSTFPTGSLLNSKGEVTREARDKTNVQSDFRHDPRLSGDQSKNGRYVNQYLLTDGVIVADQNYSVEGKNSKERYRNPRTGNLEGFSNSEILYQQWKLAKPHAQEEMDGQPLPDLRMLRRAHVAGPEGQKGIAAIRAENQLQDSDERTFFKGSENYYALLGLPNAIAALWLILDHGDEMNIHDIPSITLKGGNSVELNFR